MLDPGQLPPASKPPLLALMIDSWVIILVGWVPCFSDRLKVVLLCLAFGVQWLHFCLLLLLVSLLFSFSVLVHVSDTNHLAVCTRADISGGRRMFCMVNHEYRWCPCLLKQSMASWWSRVTRAWQWMELSLSTELFFLLTIVDTPMLYKCMIAFHVVAK